MISWLNLHDLYVKKRQYQKAKNIFKQILTLTPQTAEEFRQRGMVALQSREFEQAIQDFTSVLAIEIEDRHTYYQRSIAYRRSGHVSQANADYQRFLKLIPEKLIEIDWQQPRPTRTEIKAMWQELKITPLKWQSAAIDILLTEIGKTHINGGAEFAGFRISSHPIFYWFGSRDRTEEINFFHYFFTSSAIREALPTIKVKKKLLNQLYFEWGSAFTLDGEIGEFLVHGGAYKQFDGTAAAAKKFGIDFCENLFGDRYSEITIYKTRSPWSDWFCKSYWDITWLVLDKRENIIWLLCATDID